jgi:hypothetical protein
MFTKRIIVLLCMLPSLKGVDVEVGVVCQKSVSVPSFYNSRSDSYIVAQCSTGGPGVIENLLQY